jgi:anti-sigma B factor antagonist
MGDDRPWREAPLVVEEHQASGVTVLAARGELDLATAPRLTARVEAMRQTGARSVLVDLSGVEFCDSTGLRALIGAASEVRAAGGRLAITAGPDDGAVARLLLVTGASEWLDIHPDESAGIAALGRR